MNKPIPVETDGILNDIEIIEHIWIEMSDGVRLSAKIWLPVDATEHPVPAVLEIIPYRKRDSSAIRDHANHAWLAARGYVCIRPDMRGHGDSEGIMLDEYSPREQQDTIEVIEWLSKQPWCSGNVGMMGLSWGGIASMQAAAHQPDALKAVIPVGASLDRYYDDGAYLVGGYAGQGLGWGGVMFGYCIRPPDPAIVGDAWREMWFDRLNNTPMFADKWLNHQQRDETWKQGSVCEDYDKVKIPVLGVSGWNDCWPNTMIRLLENIDAPCRVVSGAWAHVFPNLGGPGPQMGFLQLALDWWDHWLKGIDNGVMDAPAFLAYVQDSHAPDPNPNERPGRWVGEENWPSPNIETRLLNLHNNSLIDATEESSGSVVICSPETLGLRSGEYMPISGIAELPQDQREDDASSVCFETAPLDTALELLGTTNLRLRLSSDSKTGLIAARICDVAPNGVSTLISYGILNLKQREGKENNAAITPNKPMDICVRLNDTGWSLKPGHRLRLALSTQFWPMAWPVADQTTLTLDLAHCQLELPVRNAKAGGTVEKPFASPDVAAPLAHSVVQVSKGGRNITRNVETGKIVYDVTSDENEVSFEDADLTYRSSNTQRYSITEGEPLSAEIYYQAGFSFVREGWDVRTNSKLTVTCDAEFFYLKGQIEAYEDAKLVFERDWDLSIPRTVF